MVQIFAVLAATVLWASPVVAQQCEWNKVKATGQYAACRMKAEAKAVKRAKAPDYSKCNRKFTKRWRTVEAKGGESCPVTGDAASIQGRTSVCTSRLAATIGDKPLVRFVDNRDGTISDNRTGLMWEKKINFDGDEDTANLQDADNTYVWANFCTNAAKMCQPTAAAAALCSAFVEGEPFGCEECYEGEGECEIPFGYPRDTIWNWVAALNASAFAGHTDWRLPTHQELHGIFDYSQTSPPLVDVAFYGEACGGDCSDVSDPSCSCTESDYGRYWSATTHAYYSEYAAKSDFLEGDWWDESKWDNNHVRAVRGGR